MNKVDQILEKHDLRKELTEDEQFMRSVKDLFKEHGMDVDQAEVEGIIDSICRSLDESRKLSEGDLNDIAGGVQSLEPKEKDEKGGAVQTAASPTEKSGSKYSKAAQVADVALRATTTVIGAVVGAPFFGVTHYSFTDSKSKQTFSGNSFSMPSAVVGAGIGSVVGYKLGKAISRKLGLSPTEEELIRMASAPAEES